MSWNWLEVGDVSDIGTLKGELLLWVWSMLWEYALTLTGNHLSSGRQCTILDNLLPIVIVLKQFVSATLY